MALNYGKIIDKFLGHLIYVSLWATSAVCFYAGIAAIDSWIVWLAP